MWVGYGTSVRFGMRTSLGRALAGVDLDVVRHVALGERLRLHYDGELPRGFLDLDHVADLHLVRGDVDPAAVDLEVAVVDELAGGEHGRHELGAVDDRVEPALQQADQVRARVALHPERLDIVLVELPLGNVAVVALDLLLGLELGAEVGRLALAALAMLAGAVLALVERAPGTAPDVLAHAAIDLILGLCALRHRGSSVAIRLVSRGTRPPLRPPGRRQVEAEQGPRPWVRQTESALSRTESALAAPLVGDRLVCVNGHAGFPGEPPGARSPGMGYAPHACSLRCF